MFAAVHEIRRDQRLPISLSECWSFFSNPLNLPKITPAWLGFEVETVEWNRMYAGMLLKYRVRPLFGIPMRWVTEITHVADPTRFIDEQRLGPYLFWHYQHHFHEIKGGVMMTDIVNWSVGWGPLGPLINRLLVQRRVEGIFEFRNARLEEMFGRMG